MYGIFLILNFQRSLDAEFNDFLLNSFLPCFAYISLHAQLIHSTICYLVRILPSLFIAYKCVLMYWIMYGILLILNIQRSVDTELLHSNISYSVLFFFNLSTLLCMRNYCIQRFDIEFSSFLLCSLAKNVYL